MVDSHELKPHEVAAYTAKFAPPPNIREAIEKLGNNRVVVLAGPRGCGRRMSAVWLLSQKRDLTMHEVERELGENFLPSDLAAEDHVCWLLDLRDDDASVQLSFGSTLAARREDLKDQSSYLAVIIREDLWRKVGAGGEELLVQLTPARAADIILQYLTKHEPPISEDDAKTWLQYPDINKSIENLTPPDAALWAESIHAEHFTPPKPSADTPLKDVIPGKAENVLSARRAWRAELLKWHNKHSGGRERAFLLAAAALENMPAEQVFTGSARLSAALGNEENHTPRGLTGPGIIELVDSAGADLSAVETVRFRRPGYADAILEYFWTDRMHLRTEFVSWLSTEEALNKGDREAEAAAERIGQYVLLWSVRRNSLDLIEKVTRQWAENKNLSAAAENLMTAAGLDPVLGKSLRDRMLDWARNETTPMKVVVARACGGPLGRVHPGVMLYRIAALADSGEREVTNAIKDAMRRLWDIPRIRERIRKEMATWYSSPVEARRTAARNSFAAIAGLTDESNVPVTLPPGRNGEYRAPTAEEDFSIKGWRCVLDDPRPSDEAVHSFSTWMDAATASEETYASVRDVFTAAVYSSEDDHFNDRRHTTLMNLLYTWTPASTESPEKARTRDSLLETVRELDPLRRPREAP
jgi:hypothetical protein